MNGHQGRQEQVFSLPPTNQCSGRNGGERDSRYKKDGQILMSRECHLPVVHPVTLLAVAIETGREGAVHWDIWERGAARKITRRRTDWVEGEERVQLPVNILPQW